MHVRALFVLFAVPHALAAFARALDIMYAVHDAALTLPPSVLTSRGPRHLARADSEVRPPLLRRDHSCSAAAEKEDREACTLPERYH